MRVHASVDCARARSRWMSASLAAQAMGMREVSASGRSLIPLDDKAPLHDDDPAARSRRRSSTSCVGIATSG